MPAKKITVKSAKAVIKKNSKTAKNKGGRPCSVTKDAISKLEQAFRVGASISQAYHYAGISRSAFYRYSEDNPEFREQVKGWIQETELIAKISLMDGIENDPRLAYDYLTKGKRTQFHVNDESDTHEFFGVKKTENLNNRVNAFLVDED